MPDDPITSLSTRSQQADPPADIQRAVIVNRLWPITMVGDRPTTELTFCFFPNGTEKQKAAVRTTILKQARDVAERRWKGDGGRGFDPISESESEKSESEKESEEPPTKKKRRSRNPFDFKTWQDYANVEFTEIQDQRANIRITFQGKGYHSDVGTWADDTADDKPTVTLAGLADRHPPSKADRRSILHEFGHVLGLYHEHQGPHAGDFLKLDREAIKSHYGYDEATAASNFFNMASETSPDIWNYTNFDRKSIMAYHLRKKWQLQEDKIKIKVSLKLSKYDQASIKLMYPPDLRIPKNVKRFRKALNTLHVDETVAGKMIADFTGDPDNGVDVRLTRLRDRFNQWKDGVLLYKPKLGILHGIDPASLRQSGIHQFVGETAKNKLFRSIVKNIVYRAMVQRGIPTTSIPGAMQTEVTRLIAALSMHDEVGQLVRQDMVAFAGADDDGNKATDSTTTTH